MDPKFAIFFMLIGGVLTLSHLDGDNLAKMKRRLTRKLTQFRG